MCAADIAVSTIVALAAPPSPVWFVARAAGLVTLGLLSATVCTGLLAGRSGQRPAAVFVQDELHRYLMLVLFSFLAVHVATILVDPFTRFRLTDVLVPFGADYRRLWMGLGILAAELAIALALSVHLRPRLGYRTWRTLHYGTYVLFPLSLLHGMGTGTDTRNSIDLAAYAVCSAAVAAAAAARLAANASSWRRVRWPGMISLLGAAALITLWATRGPLAPGWSRAAGTPQRAQLVVTLLPPSTPTESAASRLRAQ